MGPFPKNISLINSPIIIDNFYDNNEVFLNASRSLKYEKSKLYNFPGERTIFFSLINPELQNIFIETLSKYFSETEQYDIYSSFQKIDGNFVENLSGGWVHTDGTSKKTDPSFSFIVYLNPDADPKTGTTFCKPKLDSYSPNSNLKFRNAYYSNQYDISDKEFVIAKEKHNDRFEDYLFVENKYNRLLMFPSSIPHKQNSFGNNGYIRYTQVSFAYLKGDDDE
jgi:hypothetical protein